MARPEHPNQVKIDLYRQKSVETAERASLTKDEFMRQSWLNISEAYHDMADRLARALPLSRE